MSDLERSPEDEEISSDDRRPSFIQRLQRHFGDDVDPEINLQGQPDDEDSDAAREPHEESSSMTRGLVKKLTEQVSVSARYQIKREIARGGMGTVMRVWDDDLRRNLAMKVLNSKGRFDDDSDLGRFDEEKLVRFLEEAQITGQLDHPGIVPVHDLGIDSKGRCYFTMRLVRGRELKEVLDLARDGKENWTRTRVLTLILKICEAMAFAHSKGVVHRDLKPTNVMVGRFGEVYVMDWGLARVLGRADASERRSNARAGREDEPGGSSGSFVRTVRKDEAELNPDSPLVTMDGDVVGTPSYMALEQARGRLGDVGPRSDVYALGAILYYMLTGRSPYVEKGERVSPHTVLNRVLTGPPEPAATFAKDEPPELVAICAKAMSRDAKDRYPSMLDVADDIQAFLEGRVVRAYEGGSIAEFRKWMARNRGMAAAVAGLIVLSIASAVGFALQKQKRVTELDAKADEIRAARDEAQANALRATDALSLAQEREKEAAENAVLAQDSLRRAERSSYIANVLAADFSLRLDDVAEARRRLDASSKQLREWEYHHLNHRANAALATYGRNSGRAVDEVHWSRRGDELFVMSPDGIVRFLDPRTGEPTGRPSIRLAILTTTTFSALTPLRLAVTYDESRIAIVGNDATIRVFDGAGVELLDFPLQGGQGGRGATGHEGLVRSAAFSRTGQLLASGGNDGSLLLWNAQGQIVRRFLPHAGAVMDIAWSPDSRTFASASFDGTVRLWDAGTGRLEAQLLGHNGGVRAVVWDDDGEHLFTAGEDGLVNQWTSSGRLLGSLAGHKAPVHSLALDPLTERVVSASEDRTVRVWDPATGEVAVLHGHEASVRDVAFSPDGSLVVSADEDGEIKVWDARGDLATTDLDLHRARIQALATSPDGRWALSGDESGELVLWDALSGAPMLRLRGHRGAIESVAFAPDSRACFSSSADGSVRRWSVDSGREMSVYLHDSPVTGMVLGRDGGEVITAAKDEHVRVFDVESGLVVRDLEPYKSPLSHLALHPDGRTLLGVSGTNSGTHLVLVDLLDVAKGRGPRAMRTGSFFYDCAFSPDGRRIASGSMRGTVGLWDAEAGRATAAMSDHTAQTFAVAYHPGGARFASGGKDGTVRVRDAETGESTLVLYWPGESVTELTFSTDGTRLVGGTESGRVRIWETGDVEARRAAWLAERRLVELAGPRVESLFDEHFFQDEVLKNLQSDRSLPADVRAAGIRLTLLRGDDPNVLYRRSLDEALLAGDTPEVYAHALRRAEAALGMGDGDRIPVIQLAVGVARYRAGDHEGAGKALERAGDLSAPLEELTRSTVAPLTPFEDSVRLIFLAMAYHRTGRRSMASSAFAEVSNWISNHPDFGAGREEATTLLREAEYLLGSPE